MKNVGDYILFRKDVCKIVEVKENPFNRVMSYSLIPITDETLKMNVPVDNENIRDLMTKKELENLIQKVKSIPIIEVDDKLMEQEYKRLLKEETKEGLIQIIKTTYLRNQKRMSNNKKISDKDKSYFDKAESYLYLEIATVLGITEAEARDYLIHEVSALET